MMILPPAGYFAPTVAPIGSTIVVIGEPFAAAIVVTALVVAGTGAAIGLLRRVRRSSRAQRAAACVARHAYDGGVIRAVAGGRS
jgi:hypothetical protein